MTYSQLQQLENLLDALERTLKRQEKWRELATLNFVREIVTAQYSEVVPLERDASNTIMRINAEL